MVIGISGKRGTGKTTSADFLVKEHKFTKISFADELRVIARQFYPFSELDFGIARKEKPYKTFDWTPRDFMLHLGEFARFHELGFWINKTMEKCKGKGNFVIDDVRFKNEAAAIKAVKGHLVRIERYEKHNPYGKDLDIVSETDLDSYKFDFTVPRMRNITLDELYRQMNAFAEDVLSE